MSDRGEASKSSKRAGIPFSGLRRAELVAIATVLFVGTSAVLFLQDVVIDPAATGSVLVRFRSPVGDAEEVRPIIRCSLNAVDVVPPSDVWVVGNRGLVLHSSNSGLSWEVVASTRPPVPAAAKASRWPVITPTVHAAAVPPPSPSAYSPAPPPSPPSVATPLPQAEVTRRLEDSVGGWGRDVIGIHFAREAPPGRGWIVYRSGAVLATDDGGIRWEAAGNIPLDAASLDILFEIGLSKPSTDDPRIALLRSALGGSVLSDAVWTANEDGRVIRRPRGRSEPDLAVPTDGRPLYGVFFLDAATGWSIGTAGRIFSINGRDGTAESQDSPTTADLYSVAFMPDGRRGWAVGAGGTIVASADGGERWRPVTIPFGAQPRPWSPNIPYWYALSTLTAFGLLLRAARMEDPPEPDESIADKPTSDRPVQSPKEDVLDFQSVARGLSRFLRNEKTAPPLTMAVIGEWGTGKSSLMNLLRADLRTFGFRAVWFNAWHHQKEEHLLAALLQTVRLQAIPPLWTPAGWEFRGRLMLIHLRRHWAIVALVLALFMAVAGFERAHHSLGKLITMDARQLADLAGRIPLILTEISDHKAVGLFLASALSVVFTVVKLLRPFGVNPANLLATVSGSGRISALEAQTSFRHLFAQEFRDVTQALGPRTMPIFIDDLDRCRPQQVVDVLEAVSFLVSSGDCFVVLGMARERVEKCVGMSFKEVAEEMAGPEASASGARERRAEFARQYLDKLINIEVPIQEPTVAQSKTLLVTDPPRQRLRALAGLWPAIPLLFLMAVAFWAGSKVPPFEQPPKAPADAAPPGPSPAASSPPGADSGGQRETFGLTRDPATWPPVGTADETPELATPPRRASVLAYAIVWPLGLALALGCVWILTRRRDLVVKDSKEFHSALEQWHPVVIGRRPTPRALKRFVNRLRYLATRQRPYPPSPPLWRVLLDRVSGGGKSPIDPPRPAGERIPESALVALAALEEVDPQLLRRPLTAETPLPSAPAQPGADATPIPSLAELERHRAAYLRMAGRVQVN